MRTLNRDATHSNGLQIGTTKARRAPRKPRSPCSTWCPSCLGGSMDPVWTGLELWDGTRTVGRDSKWGTGRELWDGTRTVGRDSNCGTGLELWDGTRTVGRDSNCGTGLERLTLSRQIPEPSPQPSPSGLGEGERRDGTQTFQLPDSRVLTPAALPADWEREKDGTGLEPARGWVGSPFFDR